MTHHQGLLLGLQAAVGFCVLVAAILVSVLITRKVFDVMRKESAGDIYPPQRADDSMAFAMATYQGVIQKMRVQEKELERLAKLEKQRATESQQLFATIMKNMATGLVMLNARGLITESNPAARTVLGHQVLTGRGYWEVFWPGHVAGAPIPEGMNALEDCLRTGHTVRRLTLHYRAPNGQNMVLGVGFSPIRTAEGTMGGAIMLLTDLTEITALQQEVRLKENLAALGEMSAGIAHEFKNALATISGYAQMIDEVEPEEARRFARTIHRETQLLAAIVTDFLNFSRPMNLVATSVDSRELIESSFAEISGRSLDGVTLELQGDFPMVRGDSTLLRQAFSNLLRNGFESMASREAGQPRRMLVESEIEESESGSAVRLDFHDSGCGIVPENLDKVFIPFFTTKNAGTGLGLALVHKIIVNHNGKISVTSELGRGTTFSVTLPVAAA